eukprot:TRINITY_DN769_c0_g1_i2.p1 TRINITY_DN769_c0_g1~~TRINITY_DN769_c0_g1_i2.p1  ORF type:complete len:290 (-),score=42.67 TRINITY_DN769_c0_g1_i2:630-1499(-)
MDGWLVGWFVGLLSLRAMSYSLLQPELDGLPVGAQYAGQAGQAGVVFDPTGKYKLILKGAFAAVEAGVSINDGLKSTGGVMISLSNNVSLVISMDGGCCQACCRCCCAGGSLFLNHYSLKGGDRGDILLAPAAPGEIIMLNLDGSQEWNMAKNAYLCSDEGVQVGAAMQNLAQGCCGGQGLFVMRASGTGRLLISSFGSILKYELQPGEERKIDNGFLVAWNIMDYKIVKAADSVTGSVFSGEGFATKFVGPGTIYVQTRSPKALAKLLAPYLSAGGGGGDGGGGDGSS